MLAAAGIDPIPARAAGLGYMMWDYMLAYLGRLDATRKERLAAIRSPEEAETFRGLVRERLSEMWGPFPAERTPLNPRHISTIERDGYVIEKIIFESRPNFHVTANVYVPKGRTAPLPAVIFPPGHTDDGKAAEAYQRFCILMAQSGFVALIWDPIGQGERLQLWDAEQGVSLAGPGTREHRVLGNQCYLVGWNLMNFRAWDAIRVIDYLATRPDVDSGRIAMAGNSGGGMETLQFACFDDRIKAAIPMCAVSTFRHKTQAMLIADPEQILYGTLEHGIDHPELLAAFAPKALMVGSAKQDYIPIEGARQTFQEVSRVYQLFASQEKLSLIQTEGNHGLNKELREAAAAWLRESLGPAPPRTDPVDPHPAESPAATEQKLRCKTTGQVASAFGGATVASLIRERAKQIAPKRVLPANPSEMAIYRNEIIQLVQEITRVGPFRRESDIVIPDRNYDVGPFAKGLAIVIADLGKDDPIVRRSVIDPLVASGYQVIGMDLRGWGESAPVMPNAKVRFDWEDFFAYRSLEIGRPLLGQRIKDLLAIAPRRVSRPRWIAVGVGAGALVAAHAAVLEQRIEEVISIGGLLSYQSLIDDPLSTQPFSSYLPGVIGAYDMRDVYAAIAPRRLLVINPQDSQRRPVEEVPAWEQLDWVTQMYERSGKPDWFAMHTKLDAAKFREILVKWLDR
jgi:cephalosporin-C deacetylase-like acetyl esterase